MFSNGSNIQVIYLTGFPAPQFNHLLFALLICTYLFIIIGNALIFLLICIETSLNSPMYYFIGQLSCLEIVYTAVTIPKMLADLLDVEKKVSFVGCLLQAYCLHVLAVAECYMLTIMAYDRFLAICKPLHYSTIMTIHLFAKLVIVCLVWSLNCPVFEMILISRLPFCGPNRIKHLFCDLPPLFELACTDTSTIRLADSSLSSLIMLNFACILFSYAKIIYVVMKIKSKVGRQKAFSTCGSHLIIVTLFFGSIGFMYIRVAKSYSSTYNSAVGLIFVVFTPLANPVIYGLKNKEIKQSFANFLGNSLLKKC
ncbi:olfactory receptor 6N1-like [Gastrophryne carolinensis]